MGGKSRFDPQHYLVKKWSWDSIGFHVGGGLSQQTNYKPQRHVATCTVSYWYLIALMTLLSVPLLVVKPRSLKTQQSSTETHFPHGKLVLIIVIIIARLNKRLRRVVLWLSAELDIDVVRFVR